MIIATIICFFYGCGSGVGDTAENLSGGYSLRSDGGSRYILPVTTMFEKGVNSKITDWEFNDDFILLKQEPDYNHHRSFLALSLRSNVSAIVNLDSSQNPGQYEFYTQKFMEDSALYGDLLMKISSENTSADIETSERIADSILNSSPYYLDLFSRELNYWIIAHGKPEKFFYIPSSLIYGPYSQEDYLEKRTTLGVPKELSLED